MATIKRVEHIGIAVENIDEALRFYAEGLGVAPAERKEAPDQAVRTAFLPAGETHLELLEPMTPESTMRKFLDKRGEGIHHICLEVDDIQAALDQLAAQGYQLIDSKPRKGVHGLVAFVHPKSAHGVLIELTQLHE
jgi:methylmalonyl-CoA epimerase